MKKIFVAILTLLYISASIGVTLHTHYCMNTLASGESSFCKLRKCDKCGSGEINTKDNLCCRNENRFIKNDKDQNIPEPVFQLSHLTAVAIPASIMEIPCNKFASIKETNPISNAPPPGSGLAIYLRDRVFRL